LGQSNSGQFSPTRWTGKSARYETTARGEQNRRFRRRVLILVGAFLVVGVVLIARLAQMQIVWHDRFRDQYRVSASGDRLLETTRGAIIAADGVVLARDVRAFDLCVEYDHLAGHEWQLPLSRLTGMSVAELDDRAREIRRRVEAIREAVQRRTRMEDVRVVEQTRHHAVVEDVPLDAAVLVRTSPEQFPYTIVTTRSRRVYDGADIAPHAVGLCGQLSPQEWERLQAARRAWTSRMAVSEAGERYRKDDVIGKSGVELSCESVLRGRRGCVENRFYFHPLRVEKVATVTDPEPGLDVHLTLRADFQKAANNALRWAATQSNLNFRSGSLVIMDVRTGAILAAATWPTYDLKTYRENYAALSDDSRSPLLFRPTQALLPPGSVYKLITATAALGEGKITPATTFSCSGSVEFQNRTFRCHTRGGHGSPDLLMAIQESCNIYFYRTGALVGGAPLVRWGQAFGIGVPTGVDLPFAATGQIPEPLSLLETVNLSIGQGRLLCTPLQVTRMCAAFANGGMLVQPHILDCVVNEQGKVVQRFEPQQQRIEVKPETLRVVTEGMKRVVRSGTAQDTGLSQFDAAGKTGTAEVGELNHAWFAGFAPFDNPKIAFVVVSERTSVYGGSGAAPILTRALKEIWPQVEKMP